MRNKYNAKFYEGSTDHDTKYNNEEFSKKHPKKKKYNNEEQTISDAEISAEFDDETVDYKNTLEYGQKYYQSAKQGNSRKKS